MKPTLLLSSGAMAAVLLAAGCAGYYEEQRTETARQRTEVGNQRTEIDQLRARVEALEKLQQDMDSRLAARRAEDDKQRQEMREQLAAMERTLKAYEASREADKQAIINDLTAKIAKIADLMRPPPPPARPGAAPAPAGSTGGREHVVVAGETLSAIAATYKVRLRAIVEANGLKDANSLKVGQRLAIPE